MPEPTWFLREAIRAVPAVRWALAIGGVLAVPAIVFTWYKTKDLRVLALCVIVMLFLMMVMVIFAKAAGQPDSVFHLPALVFTWFCLLLFIAISCVLFGSIFLGHPHLDWSFITHASLTKAPKPEDDKETIAESDEEQGDIQAANGISKEYCFWHRDCQSGFQNPFYPAQIGDGGGGG
jgi:hypothetical protein